MSKWRTVPGSGGDYECATDGSFRSVARVVVNRNGIKRPFPGRELSPTLRPDGRMKVGMTIGGIKRSYLAHRVIAETFLGPCPDGMEVCHNNGDPTDNRLANLRYDTPQNNSLQKNEHGTMHQRHRTHCPQGHPLEDSNLVASHARRGHRKCISCTRARSYIQHHGSGDLQEIADRYYRSL